MAGFGEYFLCEDKPPRKILFLGDEKVGKTTFIKKYCEYMRVYYRCDSYKGIFLAFTQFLVYRDHLQKRVPIRFLDLPSGTTRASRRDQYPAVVDLIVLCFSIDNPTSLDNVLQIWIPEFREYYPEFTRFYLLGLKQDMRLEMLAAGKTPVSVERVQEVHEQYQFYGEYLECSVEGNPQKAVHYMDIILCDAPMYD